MAVVLAEARATCWRPQGANADAVIDCSLRYQWFSSVNYGTSTATILPFRVDDSAASGLKCLSIPYWVDRARLRSAQSQDATTSRFIFECQAFGWPMRCMSLDILLDKQSGAITVTRASKMRSGKHVVDVPLRVLWIGLLINAICLGCGGRVVVHIGLGAAQYMRRRERRQRGQCEQCGYHIGTARLCPECGGKARA